METIVQLLGPLHPPLVHFAVASPILALLAVLAWQVRDRDWLLRSAAALWVLSFLAALGAGATGRLFSLSLGLETGLTFLPSESAAQGVLRDHAVLGTLTLLFSIPALWASFRIFRGATLPKPLLLGIALVLAFFSGWTGHEGGEMVYGEKEPAPAVAAPSETQAPATQAASPAPAVEGDLLEEAAGYRSKLVKMNQKPWNSRTHGHRWVNTYVSKEAVEAYKRSDPIPEGSLVVKESFEDEDGKPSRREGPLYVMKKGPLSGSRSTGGWKYALSWSQPVPGNPEGLKEGPVRWLPGDRHLASCVKCHNHFKLGDYVGGIPEGYENP